MATRGIFTATDLKARLDDHGAAVSYAHVARLIARAPDRVSLRVLAALCGALDCTPTDLIAVTSMEPPADGEALRAARLALQARTPGGGTKMARIANELRTAITSGRLAGGTRLPSSRDLAAELGISRAVLTAVYQQLAAEGRLISRQGGGTIVVPPPTDRP